MEDALNAGLIIFIIVGAIGLSRYWRHRMRLAEMRFQAERESPPEIHQELKQLQERVTTLERIVTDKGYNLQEEIERLR